MKNNKKSRVTNASTNAKRVVVVTSKQKQKHLQKKTNSRKVATPMQEM
jgi:hypothetical protein